MNEPSAASGLLVDDSRLQVLSRKRVLDLWGIETDVATTMAEAERKADSHEYAFAMLDFAMPDAPAGPGPLIRKLRERSPRCSIFVLTAYPDQAQHALADLRPSVWEKPLDWKRFEATLASLGS